MRTTHPITTRLDNYTPMVMLIAWLNFGGVLLETFFFVIYFRNVRWVISRLNTVGHISEMVGQINMKWKGSTLVGYWVSYLTLTFDPTHDLGLEVFKVEFWNSTISLIVGPIDVKWKGSKSIGYWANHVIFRLTIPMTLALNFEGQSLK